MRHAFAALLLTVFIVATLAGLFWFGVLIYLAATGDFAARVALVAVALFTLYALAWRATGLEMNS